MGRRRWALTVGLVVVAAVAAVVAVAAANSRANDVEREADALAELEDELARGLLVEEEVSEAKTLLAEHTQVADDARATARTIAQSTLASSPRAGEVAKYMIHAAVGEDRAAMVEALGSEL